jgi:hypothetical protein
MLAPSERYATERGKRHKKITDRARQLLFLVRRWWPEREIVAVAESDYAAIALLVRLARLRKPIAVVTRLRLDAALYEPAPPRKKGQIGRPRLKGKRLPNLAVVAEDPSVVWRPVTVSPIGTAVGSVPSRSFRRRRSGTTRDCRRYSCVGCWCVIHNVPSPPKPSCAPTLRPIPCGTTKPTRPSPMRWRWYGGTCGRKRGRLFAGRLRRRTR